MKEGQHNKRERTGPARFTLRKFVLYVVLPVGSVLILAALLLLFFPDPFINTFLKGRITEALEEAYPAYSFQIGSIHYGAWDRRVGCDSVMVEAVDSSLSCSVAKFSVSGIGWMQLLVGDGLASTYLAGSVLEADSIRLRFPLAEYDILCKRLRVSVPDSELTADALEIHPSVDDDEFFAESRFRRTRFTLTALRWTLKGVDCLKALDLKNYHARSVRLDDVALDVLINKEKPSARDTSTPPMPNGIFASMKDVVQWDSVTIVNSSLRYGERFFAGAKPALISMDSIVVGMERLVSRGGAADTVMIRAQAEFMRAAKMTVVMSIPVSASEFSLRYSGSLGTMELRALNPFLEIAEAQRFKAGTLQGATFDINVVAGRARGNVRAVYRGLSIATLNKQTGSEKGILDKITSFVANNVKLRTTNVPGKRGEIKLGEVQYMRQRDDPFFRFIWFALRSGVKDVVGF